MAQNADLKLLRHVGKEHDWHGFGKEAFRIILCQCHGFHYCYMRENKQFLHLISLCHSMLEFNYTHSKLQHTFYILFMIQNVYM